MDDADHFLLTLPSLLPNSTYIPMLNRKLWKTLFSIIFSNNKFLCQINLISSLSSSTSNSSIVELLQLSFFCSFDIFFCILCFMRILCAPLLWCVQCTAVLHLPCKASFFLSLVEARTHFCSLGSLLRLSSAVPKCLCQLLTFCYCRLLASAGCSDSSCFLS